MDVRGNAYKRGDWVVYRKTKHSTQPGPRAHDVAPSVQGDTYSYVVDKFWVVADVPDEELIVLRTRRGKQHVVDADDLNLRRANLWERLWYTNRFRAVEQAAEAAVG